MMSLARHELMGFADQQFGNYRLIRLIGRGGFADVYLAQHIHVHHHQAVVKILRGPLSQRARQRFQEEASMLMSLNHQHIVRVLDFGIQNGTPYLIMQLATHDSLRRMHPAGTKLPLRIVLHYLQQSADALTYLHRQRLVHNDIKPENMLLDDNYNVLLADFGLATMTDKANARQSEDFAGTFAYTAPERFLNNYALSPASDQYSLAIVAYELLTGRRPFHGTAQQLMHQHLNYKPLPLHLFVPDIPPQVESVIRKALRKDPLHRFPSVQAFVDALREAYESSPRPSIRPTRTPARRPNARPSRTSSKSHSSSRWLSWEVDVLDGTLVVDLFIAMLAGLAMRLFRQDGAAAWGVFSFVTFVLPIVHAFFRGKLLEVIVFASMLLLSVVAGNMLHFPFLSPFIQLFLLVALIIVAAIRHIRNSQKHS